MPSKTPTGLPYPLATDPVRDGATAVQALAAALDVRVQAGTAVVATNPQGDGYVPFPVAFRSGTVPVFVPVMSDPASGYVASSYRQYTNSDAGLVHVSLLSGAPATGTVRVEWIAVGVVG
jgi:hypothetical protein